MWVKKSIYEENFKLFFYRIYFSQMYSSINAKEEGNINYITDIIALERLVGGQLYIHLCIIYIFFSFFYRYFIFFLFICLKNRW